MCLQGLDQHTIAKKVGLTQQRVSQILNNEPEIKKVLEDGQKAQVLLIPLAVQKHTELLDSEDEKIALEAAKLIYKNTGITPSHAQSVYIQNLTVSQQNIISPDILALLDRINETKDSQEITVSSDITDIETVDNDTSD